MAAGLGFKTFTTGEVLTAADVNGYLMQGVLVFASEAARNSAITSPQEGQFAYTKDNNSLWYYTGSAWAASGATGDIEGVTAGTGISGGGTSGTVTITNSMATAIDAKGDLVVGTGADTFSRLAVGTNGQVLTADSGEATGLKFATPAGGGWTLLYTVSLSGATAVTQNVDFTGYQQAIVVVDNTKDAANTYNLSTQFNGAGTGVYGVVTSFDSGSVVTRSNGRLSQEGSGGAQKSNTIVEYFLTINNPASTTKFKQLEYVVTFTRNAVGDPIWAQEIVGYYRSTSAITSITFDSNAGNMASGSQALIYGVK